MRSGPCSEMRCGKSSIVTNSPQKKWRRSATPIVDPRQATTALAVRFGAGRCSGHRVDFLLAPLYTLVCSPLLLEGKFALREPSDIRKHVLIHDEAIPGAALRPSWEEWIRAAGIKNINASLGLRFGNPSLALDAALNGQGVVLAPEALITAEVTAGRLVTPFDIKIATRHYYYLATPEAVADRPEVAAFRSWLIAEMAKPIHPFFPGDQSRDL